MNTPTKPTETANTPDDVAALVARARKGDAAAVPGLRVALRNPATVEALGGNLARGAQLTFLKAMFGDDLALREAVHAKLDALRAELLGADPTPVERLLVERVAACWLQVQDADLRSVQNQKDVTIKQADFHQRRMDAANRRYLAALRTLATVRKLALPTLQINLARKQINVVGTTSAGVG